ncbi:PREDICTED: uncharacterized protein LOC104607013 isoform X2 [Nelumbo nucifera]|uniref:Uncharacterized protein LOC104607013 isoform X2 n=1 Tax=Nelumbo nucifera TaxID=4432 RepID=A0A1U8B3Z5_NELNU|nr:PREDICTED: uncharacterized protein LOC104607013 isoform X2 [Nelumbo nucifera]
MGKRNRKPKTSVEAPKSITTSQEQLQSKCYEGEDLTRLLESIKREIELAKLSKGTLPEKIWIKQQFSIGVNDVTRVLERMTTHAELGNSLQKSLILPSGCKAPLIELQAILLASDCNPRWLTRHLPSLSSSRRVPLIFVKDQKGGSLRLGELVNLKTAIAIGIKKCAEKVEELLGKDTSS